MSTFDVKVRNLQTGRTSIASPPDYDTCARWLSQRPRNVEILGVLGDTSSAARDRPHGASRPYDADRGQTVGEAHPEVWQGDMPAGETHVREGGRLYPRQAG
jgi:hypothetical protein